MNANVGHYEPIRFLKKMPSLRDEVKNMDLQYFPWFSIKLLILNHFSTQPAFFTI